MPSLRSRFVKQFVRLRIQPLLRPHVPVEKVRRRTNYLASYGWYPYLVHRERFRIGEIDVAAFTPRKCDPLGMILFLHGGGYCFGSIRMYADLAARLATAAQARVVLPEYRLAPEHRFPAAFDDARRVYEWLLEQGASPRQLAVAGDSAGGGLSLALATAVRDAGLPLPAALALLSPWTDATGSGPTLESHAARDPMLAPDVVRRSAAMYADGEDLRDPRLSPLFANLAGLPPVLIQVGTEEVLLSDSTRLAEALRDAGVDVTLQVAEGMWHVWHLFAWAVPEAKSAIEEIGRFVQAHWRAAAKDPRDIVGSTHG